MNIILERYRIMPLFVAGEELPRFLLNKSMNCYWLDDSALMERFRIPSKNFGHHKFGSQCSMQNVYNSRDAYSSTIADKIINLIE